MNFLCKRLVLICLCGNMYSSFSQMLPSGPQVLTFFSSVDDTEQPYGLYLPKKYDSEKKYPLVIMLHGAGSNHRLALRRVFGKSNTNGETDVEASRYFPAWNDVDYIVAAPYARGTMGYQGVAEQDVYDVLADVKKRFSIDDNRIYLTGLSMGGGGTLWIGLTHPSIWAAIAPVCPAPPKETDNYALNALNFPVHFFHGEVDHSVPVTVSRDWTKKLKEAGTQVEYTEYPGVDHNSWEKAYADGSIFEWFSKFKRNPFPYRVRFNSSQYKYNAAYWLRLDQFTPGTTASIDAKYIGINQLEVVTTSLSAFTIHLKEHPQFKAGEPVLLTIDGGKIIKEKGYESLSLVKQNGKWVISEYKAPLLSKTVGAEGPIREAFASRHVYVYGTGGNPTEEELKARMSIATEAANWSVYRNAFLGRVMVFPRVVSDKEVRPSDFESSNLILFGTKETNSVIEKYSDRLPLTLNATAKNYGLLYIFPFDGRYIVINSGLPWWTGVKDSRFLPASLTALNAFKDFILFKDAATNVVVDGYFDDGWKVAEGDRKRLSESVVTVTGR